MVNVCCVWVKANVPYGVEYVANLRAMVKKHLTRTYRLWCLTDRPLQLPYGVAPIPIAHDKTLFGWWAKVQMFRHGLFQGRVLYLDLDSLIVTSLDPIVDFPASLALLPHQGTFTGRYKGKQREIVPRFNSSVMVWDADSAAATSLYRDWDPSIADRLHGDQDWIGERVPYAATMPAEWFPRLSMLEGNPPSAEAKVVLCKVPKNTIAADLYPWVNDVWRAA